MGKRSRSSSSSTTLREGGNKRSQARRVQETRDAAMKRERDAARKRAARQRETPETAAKRRELDAVSMSSSRERETPETAAKRRELDAVSKSSSRERETPETAAKRRELNAVWTSSSRERETPETAAKRRELNAASTSACRKQQIPEAALARRVRTAASTSASRRRQTPEAVVARHVRDAANRDALDAQLQEVAEGILERRDVDLETLQLIALNQNWTKHPHLALVYFHCCANHPDAFVCNDEKLHGDAGATVFAPVYCACWMHHQVFRRRFDVKCRCESKTPLLHTYGSVHHATARLSTTSGRCFSLHYMSCRRASWRHLESVCVLLVSP